MPPQTPIEDVLPAPARRRLKPADRERQLLAAAERMFSQHGPEVTMDEIAEYAGVTKPVLYRHFSSKDALLAACMRTTREELFRATSTAALAAQSLEEALWLTLRTFFGFVADPERSWWLLSAEGALSVAAVKEEVHAMRSAQSEVTAGLVTAALPGMDPRRARLFVEAIDGASERIARWLPSQPDADLDDVTDEVIEAFVLGLRSLRTGERWQRPDFAQRTTNQHGNVDAANNPPTPGLDRIP